MKKKLPEIVINGKYCYLSILKPKDYKKLYKLRFKVNKLKIVNDIPKDPKYQKIFIEDQIKKFFFGIYLIIILLGLFLYITFLNLNMLKLVEWYV